MNTERAWRITLIRHTHGVAVSCAELRGFHSQGATKDEALANTRDAGTTIEKFRKLL